MRMHLKNSNREPLHSIIEAIGFWFSLIDDINFAVQNENLIEKDCQSHLIMLLAPICFANRERKPGQNAAFKKKWEMATSN